MQEYKAACRGCHGGCMHIITVEDGKAVRVRPDPDGPLNHGRGCVKGLSILEQMYHKDRILYPMRRIGEKGSGQWQRITWDEAYEVIAEKLNQIRKESGPESVALISGTGRHHLSQFWRFGNVLETPNATSSGALICLGPRKNAGDFTSGHFAGVDYYGEVKPACILVWGANPAISGADGELQFHIQDAVRNKTPLVVIDPKPNMLTRAAKYWLPVRPGTDGALAMGMLHIILKERLYDREFAENWTVGLSALEERCSSFDPETVSRITDIPASLILEATRYLASVHPMAMEWGCAIEQSVNAFQTCRAIYLIPALLGNYDIPGGFVESLEIAPTADILLDRLSPEQAEKCITGPFTLCNGAASPKLFAHPWMTLDAIKTGKPYRIRAMISAANNTLISVPDSLHTYACLKELEFFVYMDFFLSPTAELAEIVLPAALWPEIDSVYCMPEFGDVAALCMRKTVQVGECKSDEEFFLELCSKMGLDYGATSQREILNGILCEMGRRRPEYAGMDFDAFAELGYVMPQRKYRRYRDHGFDTPSGKFELYSQRLADVGSDPLPDWHEVPESPVSRPDLLEAYPLILTTGSRTQPYFISNNRQIRSLRRQHPFPLVSMSPETGARYGLKEGDWAWIRTQRGEITQKVQFLREMPQNLVSCEMGWWYPEAGAPDYGWQESNANVLTVGDGENDPVTGSYQLRALLCSIRPNPDCTIEERYRAWLDTETI